MEKKVVLIASVLKPVNDPRMYEKIGMALFRQGKYEVHIAGFCSHKHVRDEKFKFHVILCANRLSWKRFAAPVIFYKKMLKVKPDVVVVCTPDLLIVTALYRILFRPLFLYDVRENYYLNLVHTHSFPLYIRNLFALFVRAAEWLTHPLIDRYVLAEKCYVQELPFIKNRYTVLENKYQPKSDVLVVPRRRTFFRLLYTGTIAETYGVFEAISLVRKLHQADGRYTLTIIGYAAQPSVRNRVRKETSGCSYIRVIGLDYPVPHAEIIRCINLSDIALTPYLPNRSTRDKIPTKFYEYIYHRIPFVIQSNPAWEAFTLPYRAAITLDFTNPDLSEFLASIHSYAFYQTPFAYRHLIFNLEKLSKVFSNKIYQLN